jgi:hypothetical protein
VERTAPPVKQVVSVSLGSSRRDHVAEAMLFGVAMRLERRGYDGDIGRAMEAVRELDGHVDAIGLGGLDVYLYIAGRRYVIRDGLRLMEAASRTPVTDGSGAKRHLEPAAVTWLRDHGPFPLNGCRVLMVSALDRFGMAEALAAAGCDMTFGDLMFLAGVPYPIRSLDELAEISRKMARELCGLPIHMLYPVGSAQERGPEERFPDAYREADLIAGDFHLIRRFLPPDGLAGKAVLTNTTTAADRELLRARGVRWLVTTTPVLAGRSYGNNVIEAGLCAALGRRPEEIGQEDYRAALADYRPSVIDLCGSWSA